MWTKNKKGNNFLRTKTSKIGKMVCLHFDAFFYVQNLFLKQKINRFEIVLITSYTILLTCTPIYPPMQNLFVCIYFYLWSSVRISFFMRIFSNLSYLWVSLLFVRIFWNLCHSFLESFWIYVSMKVSKCMNTII